MKTPRFEDFQYTGMNTEGEPVDVTQAVTNSELRMRVAVAAGDDGQQLGAYITRPYNRRQASEHQIILRTTAFSDDNGRPESALFDAFLAEATGRTVIAANAPGVDHWAEDDAQRMYHALTLDQYNELKYKGSFQEVGAAVMRASHNAGLLVTDTPEYIITSSSMGVALAGGMVRTALDDNLTLRGITVAEPVNHIKRPLASLGVQFAKQGSLAPSYLKMNPQILQDSTESPGFWLKRVGEAYRANWAYARALGAGTFYGDLGDIDGLSRTDLATPVFLTRGGGSRLSPGDAFTDLTHHFRHGNVQSEVFGKHHDHPYTMTIQSVIDAVAAIDRQAE